jgi:hypothetical protein
MHHSEQVTLFCRKWASLYPIMEPVSFHETLIRVVLRHRNRDHEFRDFELCILFQLHTMEAINVITHNLCKESLEPYN